MQFWNILLSSITVTSIHQQPPDTLGFPVKLVLHVLGEKPLKKVYANSIELGIQSQHSGLWRIFFFFCTSLKLFGCPRVRRTHVSGQYNPSPSLYKSVNFHVYILSQPICLYHLLIIYICIYVFMNLYIYMNWALSASYFCCS